MVTEPAERRFAQRLAAALQCFAIPVVGGRGTHCAKLFDGRVVLSVAREHSISGPSRAAPGQIVCYLEIEPRCACACVADVLYAKRPAHQQQR